MTDKKPLPKGVIEILPNGAYLCAPGEDPAIHFSPAVGRHTEKGFAIYDVEKFKAEFDDLVRRYMPTTSSKGNLMTDTKMKISAEAEMTNKFIRKLIGRATAETSFLPGRIVLAEIVTTTFSGGGLPDTERSVSLDALDVMLADVRIDGVSAFPDMPVKAGIPGCAFGKDVGGNDVEWPEIAEGAAVEVEYDLLESVVSRIKAPDGYNPRPKKIVVQIQAEIYRAQT